MKQVVLRGGLPQVVEVPAPGADAGRVLVANLASVISSGTERAAVEQAGGGGSLPVRALRNPELIRAGLRHLRERGLRATLEVARGAADGDSPLGYSCAGVVLDTGGIAEFRVGQLVACAGAGSANHAEVVSVPGNLVAVVPEGVDPRAGAFTTLGAIALQGVRRTAPTLGERVVVVGLGIVGLLTVQFLAAAGCQVFAVEPNARRRERGLALGADAGSAPEDAVEAVGAWSRGIGADAVVICASGGSPGIVNNSVAMLRPKGRVVAVGDVALDVERAPLYRREADVLISTSYGPGRYDPTYEDAGVDYPIAYVRWTENRNMEEVLRLLALGRLEVESLIELELPIEEAAEAYSALRGPEPPLTALLTYNADAVKEPPGFEIVRGTGPASPVAANGDVRVALVGPGSFATAVHLPNLKADPSARLVVVAGRRGTVAGDVARLAGGADTATHWRAAVERDDVDLVIVTTRHDSHAEIAAAALRAGKAVFLEKPLGLSRAEIDDVWEAGRENERFAIGFNRSFAPLARTLERELRQVPGDPVHLVYRVSAPLEPGHWLNDPTVGGGRILGEACHMFDFANWLCGSPERVTAAALPSVNGVRTVESSTVTVQYTNGSVATIHYSGVGATAMPKERIEVLAAGRSWALEDFKLLTSYLPDGTRTETAASGDKGHAALMNRVLAACRGEASFEPGLGAAYVAQSVALAALESIATGESQAVVLWSR